MKKFAFSLDDSARDNLSNRAARMTTTGPPAEISPLGRSIQFLRGVHSRASMTLPAFYLFVGATSREDEASDEQKTLVIKHYTEFSALNTITMSCRKVFDNSNTALTGAKFGKSSDDVLVEHANFWAGHSGGTAEDAARALSFLRTFFASCSKSSNALLKSSATLHRRIGLLKQHADRSAAHLSLENFELDVLDVAHVAAAMVLVGEIVRSFDAPFLQDDYFNVIDQGAHEAAKGMFPSAPPLRLFDEMRVAQQARFCWKFGDEHGMQMVLEQLPFAVSWF